MLTIIDQIRELDAKRLALTQTLLDQLNDQVRTLNNLGYNYKLVEVIKTTPKLSKRTRVDSGDIRWSTPVTRIANHAAKNLLTKTAAVEAVRMALQKLAAKKGVQLPEDVLANAEKRVAGAAKKFPSS